MEYYFSPPATDSVDRLKPFSLEFQRGPCAPSGLAARQIKSELLQFPTWYSNWLRGFLTRHVANRQTEK